MGDDNAMLEQNGVDIWSVLNDDAKEVVTRMVDVGSLVKLKGVNRAWCALARRELCSRLCRREGQPPTAIALPADITDLDVECLVDAGRAWEAAAAGRLLPNLARLHGYGFEVDVAAVLGRDIPESGYDSEEEEDDEEEADEEEDGPARPFGGAALRGCITPEEGEPPLALLLAAVACAASGTVCEVPVRRLREDDAIGDLDLSGRNLGADGALLLSLMLPGATSVSTLE